MPITSRKCLRICCGVTAIIIIILVVVFITLFFTVFKPKDPQIIPHPTKLENVQFQLFPLSINATLGLNVTILNRNYGSFRFKNSTALVDYRGNLIADIPIEGASVPARGEINISTYANITADKLILSPYFWEDIGAGRFNLTSTVNLHGKVKAFKIFKFGAKVRSVCDISVYILTQNVETTCHSKIKL